MLPVMKGSFGPLPVVWTSAVNCVADGNDLTKNAGGAGWNAGAYSVAGLAANGYLEFKNAGVGALCCGVSTDDTSVAADTIDFGFYINYHELCVFESGVNVSGNLDATYVQNALDLFRVQRIGTAVTFWIQVGGVGAWSLLYTSATASTGTLHADCSIYDEGGGVTDAVTRRL